MLLQLLHFQVVDAATDPTTTSSCRMASLSRLIASIHDDSDLDVMHAVYACSTKRFSLLLFIWGGCFQVLFPSRNFRVFARTCKNIESTRQYLSLAYLVIHKQKAPNMQKIDGSISKLLSSVVSSFFVSCNIKLKIQLQQSQSRKHWLQDSNGSKD